MTDEIFAEISRRVKIALDEADEDDFVTKDVIFAYLHEQHPGLSEAEIRAAATPLLAEWAKHTIMNLPGTGLQHDH